MKKLFFAALIIAGFAFASCQKPQEIIENGTEVSVTLGYGFGGGASMTKVNNSEIFDEFYESIKDGSLVAESYDLTFVEINTGKTYHYTGKWLERATVTLKTGSYRVTGTSTDTTTPNVQAKCSITLNDTVAVDENTETVVIKADYDCSLVIFADSHVTSIKNYNGYETQTLPVYRGYPYAFVRPQLWDADHKADAYFSFTYDGHNYNIATDGTRYTYGKYYVYRDVAEYFNLANNVGLWFEIGKMEDGTPELARPEYIDLGLPSGTLWATFNVGAIAPEGVGDYFAWGETSPKSEYEYSTYKYCEGTPTSLTKYCVRAEDGFDDNKTTLELTDDAAYVNWGKDWRMPTSAEMAELLDACTWENAEVNGVAGLRGTAQNGNSIFFPFTGYRHDTRVHNTDEVFFWSSSLTDVSDNESIGMTNSGAGSIGRYNAPRINGLPVRPVYARIVQGHEYVDLGLSSGTLWATCNVGAIKPEEYGYQIAWGETTHKSKCTLATYKYYDATTGTLTKYNETDHKEHLELADDAAYVNWGAEWRTPSYNQLTELFGQCKCDSYSLNGVSGYKLTGPNGNWIFMPSAGYTHEEWIGAGYNFNYYSCDILAGDYSMALEKDLMGSDGDCKREYGGSVRPVLK